MRLRDDDRLQASADVLSRVLDGEAVLLDLASGTYFGMNEVATRVWELIRAGTTVGELRRVMLVEFEVEPSELDRDLATLLGALVERKLIRLDERP